MVVFVLFGPLLFRTQHAATWCFKFDFIAGRSKIYGVKNQEDFLEQIIYMASTIF